MRVVTANLNGIRAATSKGFWAWFGQQDADILCLQELKAHSHQLPDGAKPEGYNHYFHFAEQPGYAGVALYCRQTPDAVHFGLGAVDPDNDWSAADAEGRFIMAEFGNLSVVCLYLPSGSSSPERQAGKMAFLERLLPLISGLIESGRELIICGDLNIAHQRIDLKNWRGNQKNSGFLPEERAWFDRLLDAGLVDAFRLLHPGREQYSWWSNRGQARQNNVGWRIDYHLCTPGMAKNTKEVSVFTDIWYSDHAPVTAVFGR